MILKWGRIRHIHVAVNTEKFSKGYELKQYAWELRRWNENPRDC